MCRLVNIENANGMTIKVAEIKADTLKQIGSLAGECGQIEEIITFGSSVEDRCKEGSDIDLAIISNVPRSRLFASKKYNEFKEKLYRINHDQTYDILQFNSKDALRNGQDAVCRVIMEKGQVLYSKEVSNV